MAEYQLRVGDARAKRGTALIAALAGILLAGIACAEDGRSYQAENTWAKRSPRTETPPSPRLGYEGACAWDNVHHVLIRYGGHNQGGGGDRKTLEPGRNHAVNNHIYNFGRWVRTVCPAVYLFGVGNRVANNVMHDAPHTALFFLGNEHVIEFNEVYRVCTDTGDAGAFYIGRDWTQRGSVVRYNYFHDLAATLEGEQGFNSIMGVYLDDQASGVTVFGNLFCRVNTGVLMGGGRDNTFENNIFAFCDFAMRLDNRGWNGDSNSSTLLDRLKAVSYDRPPYSERYPLLAKILDDEPGRPKGNVIARNISVQSNWLSLSSWMGGDPLWEELVKIESNLTDGAPGLVAPEEGDFRLRDDSPALKLGFKPIPFDKIGLYRDEYR